MDKIFCSLGHLPCIRIAYLMEYVKDAEIQLTVENEGRSLKVACTGIARH